MNCAATPSFRSHFDRIAADYADKVSANRVHVDAFCARWCSGEPLTGRRALRAMAADIHGTVDQVIADPSARSRDIGGSPGNPLRRQRIAGCKRRRRQGLAGAAFLKISTE